MRHHLELVHAVGALRRLADAVETHVSVTALAAESAPKMPAGTCEAILRNFVEGQKSVAGVINQLAKAIEMIAEEQVAGKRAENPTVVILPLTGRGKR